MAKTAKKAKPQKSVSQASLRKKSAAKPSPKPAKESRRVVAELVEDHELPEAPSKVQEEDSEESSFEPATIDSKALAPTDPVALYLSEIRKYPLLSREQELELAKKYHESKDPVAAQALVTANLRFVVKVAAEYSRFGARMIDLIQEGNMGLMHAVREFNPYKGVRLITYAVWWIRGYIQEYLMKQYSLVKIGTTQNQKKLFYQLQKQREELDALGLSPDIKMLSSRLGIPEDEVEMMAQRMSGRDVSLDRPVDDESGSSLLDFQKGQTEAPDDEISKQEELSHLTEAIDALKPQLSEREKIILEERILADEPMTLQDIGEKYGITREAVRQMEVRLMKKIKEQFQKS
ncbi:MAG: RNA polymerase factor sigma-32 [Pseudobdellovibrionaceae bacterium]